MFRERGLEQGVADAGESADTALAELARKDQTNPTEAVQQAALGQAWWDFADRQSETGVKAAAGRRARRWFGGRLAVVERCGEGSS